MKKNYTLHKKYDNSKSELLDWPSVGKEIEARLGKDIYESWISKLKLIEEFQHYLVFSSPTRFIRDWVVSRYIDKILQIIRLHKKSINRIDFVIETESKTRQVLTDNSKLTKVLDKSNVSFIEESLNIYSRLDQNKTFEKSKRQSSFMTKVIYDLISACKVF